MESGLKDLRVGDTLQEQVIDGGQVRPLAGDPLVVQFRPLAVDPAAALRPLADDPADGACQADKVIANKAEAETLAREARLSDICATELELESMVGLSAALVQKIWKECAELRARDGFAARVWRSP